jgi:hypothetical protein
MINSTPMNIDAAPAVLGPNPDDILVAADIRADKIARSSDNEPNVVQTGENGASGKAKTGLDLYMSQQLNMAGGRKISGHDNKGANFMSGPYKGMELGPAMEKIRNQYNNNDKIRGQFDAEADRQNKANNLGGLDQAAATAPAPAAPAPVAPAPVAPVAPAPGLADPNSSTAPKGVDPFAPPATPATPTPAAPSAPTAAPIANLDAEAAVKPAKPTSGGTVIKDNGTGYVERHPSPGYKGKRAPKVKYPS